VALLWKMTCTWRHPMGLRHPVGLFWKWALSIWWDVCCKIWVHCYFVRALLPKGCDAVCCSALQCSTLQHTATHCNTLQHIATHCNTTPWCLRSLLTATHCNTPQRTATHCNTLQHTATRDDIGSQITLITPFSRIECRTYWLTHMCQTYRRTHMHRL